MPRPQRDLSCWPCQHGVELDTARDARGEQNDEKSIGHCTIARAHRNAVVIIYDGSAHGRCANARRVVRGFQVSTPVGNIKQSTQAHDQAFATTAISREQILTG